MTLWEWMVAGPWRDWRQCRRMRRELARKLGVEIVFGDARLAIAGFARRVGAGRRGERLEQEYGE